MFSAPWTETKGYMWLTGRATQKSPDVSDSSGGIRLIFTTNVLGKLRLTDRGYMRKISLHTARNTNPL